MSERMTAEELRAVEKFLEAEGDNDTDEWATYALKLEEHLRAVLAHLRASQTPPQAVTREQLIHCVWGRKVEVSGYISKPQEKATLNMSAAEHLADAILALFEKPAPTPTGT
jgi:hypothetical protein